MNLFEKMAQVLEECEFANVPWDNMQILRLINDNPSNSVFSKRVLYARVLFENNRPTCGFAEEEGDDAVWYALVPMGACKTKWPRPEKVIPPSDNELLEQERASHDKTRKALEDAITEVNKLQAQMNDIRVALASSPSRLHGSAWEMRCKD